MTDRDDERTDADLIAEVEKRNEGATRLLETVRDIDKLLALVRRERKNYQHNYSEYETEIAALQAEVAERKRKAKNSRQKVKELRRKVRELRDVNGKLCDIANSIPSRPSTGAGITAERKRRKA